VGVSEETVRNIARLEFGRTVCGTVARERKPIVATHIQQSDDPKVQLVKSLGIRAYACNPLLGDGDLIGTLSFASRTRDSFQEEELEFLETICQYVAVAYGRLRLLKQLRDADRRKDEFLATLAHELRNPLAPLRTGLELMEIAKDDPATIEVTRGTMERQVTQMVRLVDDLLDVSRITLGKIHLQKERLELAAFVRSVAESSRPFMESQRHQLTVAVPDQPVYVEADSVRLSQAISNLLHNAAKYTDKGGHVWLTMEPSGDDVLISVRDTGIGIEPEQMPRLFEMFSQAKPALERSQGGLGIGLALVRGLVELHGGRIDARSAGSGLGSEFTISLPVVAGPHSSKSNQSEPKTSAGLDHRVLIVDDNRDAANTLAAMLRRLGHQTQTVYDGLEAVQAAASFRPAVVLLDIGLPKMNGYEAARYIRDQPWGDGILLIALSGWGQDEDKHRALDAGFDGHLTKPVQMEAIQKLLAQITPNAPDGVIKGR
jgi:signal transduction histidine kinase/ActR/RegA family two-component response regulator